MKQHLHTPEGVRDIYDNECRKKTALEEQLHNVLKLYGYQDIQTPTFEYFDVFCKEIGTISSRELYKFFDREGETLVLRPDMTPSIARAASSLYEESQLPIRLCYIGNVFINHSSFQGRLKENTQLGAELIGTGSADADAEMIAMVVDCLKASGLTDFQITLGHVDFFQSLLAHADLETEAEERVRELVSNRNFFGAEEVLLENGANRDASRALLQLGSLTGGVEVLSMAKEAAPDETARQAVERLEQIYELLKIYEAEQYITFDLSMSGIYGYYSGIIFRAYTFGTGDAIIKGGRYDHLLEKFGKPSPSIGFAVIIGELMKALDRQKIHVNQVRDNTLILYDENRAEDAVILARTFRGRGQKTELVRTKEERSLKEYVRYAKEHFADTLLYLEASRRVLMWNLATGEQKVITGEL